VIHSTSISRAGNGSKRQTATYIPPRRIAFCGGGVRGVSHVGVLKTLEKYNLLGCVKEVFGVSCGSLFALLYALEYKISEIETLSLQLDFTLLQTYDPDTAFLFPFTYGVDSGDGLEKFLASVLKQKGFSPATTFEELQKRCSIQFTCFATELETASGCRFNVHTTPTMPVILAIRASTCIPFYYTPIRDPRSNHLYVDGGMIHSSPFAFMTFEEIQDSIGILFETPICSNIESIGQIAHSLFTTILYQRMIEIRKKYSIKLIVIPDCKISWLDFQPSIEDRNTMITTAQTATELFLKMSMKRKTVLRRVSVS